MKIRTDFFFEKRSQSPCDQDLLAVVELVGAYGIAVVDDARVALFKAFLHFVA